MQNALIKLRKTLGITQQELSHALGVALVSVGRWESSRPPSGLSLAQLEAFARDKGLQEIAAIFRRSIEEDERPQSVFKLPLPPDQEVLRGLRAEMYMREREYLDQEIDDWEEAEVHLRRLRRLQSAYLGVLRALQKACAVTLEEADEGDRKQWITNRGEVEWLIKEEQKKKWEQ